MIDALLHKEHTPYREIGHRSVAFVLEPAGIPYTMEEVHALVAEIEKLRCFPEVPQALARLQTPRWTSPSRHLPVIQGRRVLLPAKKEE